MAANKERGELPLKVGDTTYVLKLTSNACCLMETASGGRTFAQLLQGVAKECVSDIRLMLWAMLQTHHPQMSLTDVGDLIDEIGGLPEVNRELGRLVGLNTEEVTPSNGGNPQQAQAGIGGDSTSTHVASV